MCRNLDKNSIKQYILFIRLQKTEHFNFRFKMNDFLSLIFGDVVSFLRSVFSMAVYERLRFGFKATQTLYSWLTGRLKPTKTS